jgi:hypothetical protein
MFAAAFPTPESVSSESSMFDMLKPLGFVNRREARVKNLAETMKKSWSDVRKLPGIGEYGARSHEIFCQGVLGETCPNDGALSAYWAWAKRSGSYLCTVP